MKDRQALEGWEGVWVGVASVGAGERSPNTKGMGGWVGGWVWRQWVLVKDRQALEGWEGVWVGVASVGAGERSPNTKGMGWLWRVSGCW